MGMLKNCLLIMTRHCVFFAAISLVALSMNGAYAERLVDNMQVHGFVSQAYIATSDNNFWGETSRSDNFGFKELGVNISAQPTSDFHLAAQMLVRHAGNLDDGEVRLDYVLADYSIASSQSRSLGVRLGRILHPLGLYNETRDIAFTRPGILLPQSIYFDRTRDLAFSSNGIQLHGEHRAHTNEIFWQIGSALPIVDSPELELALLANDWPGSFEPDRSYLGRVFWENNGGRFKLGLSYAYVDMVYEPGFMDPLTHGHVTFIPTVFSLQYNEEKWSATSEYALRKFEYKSLGAIPNQSFTGESWYVQSTYRVLPTWEVFARYDNLFTDKDDRDGEAYAAVTSMPAYSRYAHDMTFGVKKVFAPYFMVRAEYHRVNGTAWLSTLDNQPPLVPVRQWNMFSLLASYRF